MGTGFLFGVVKTFWKQGVEKREPSRTVGGNVKIGTATTENSMEVP